MSIKFTPRPAKPAPETAVLQARIDALQAQLAAPQREKEQEK